MFSPCFNAPVLNAVIDLVEQINGVQMSYLLGRTAEGRTSHVKELDERWTKLVASLQKANALVGLLTVAGDGVIRVGEGANKFELPLSRSDAPAQRLAEAVVVIGNGLRSPPIKVAKPAVG
jgi:hypothetical protein